MTLKGICVAVAAMLGLIASAHAQDIAGNYVRTKPSNAHLVVTRAGQDWKIALDGAGDPRPPGGAPADCEMVAEGSLTGGVLTARVIPFEGEDISVSAENLAEGDHQFVVKFDARGATVIKDDVSFCGLGSDLTGRYTKTRK